MCERCKSLKSERVHIRAVRPRGTVVLDVDPLGPTSHRNVSNRTLQPRLTRPEAPRSSEQEPWCEDEQFLEDLAMLLVFALFALMAAWFSLRQPPPAPPFLWQAKTCERLSNVRV